MIKFNECSIYEFNDVILVCISQGFIRIDFILQSNKQLYMRYDSIYIDVSVLLINLKVRIYVCVFCVYKQCYKKVNVYIGILLIELKVVMFQVMLFCLQLNCFKV